MTRSERIELLAKALCRAKAIIYLTNPVTSKAMCDKDSAWGFSTKSGRDWAVLKTAPLALAGLLITGLLGGFLAGTTFRGQEVANAEGLAKLKVEENAKLTADVKTLEARVSELEKQLTTFPRGEIGTQPFPDLLLPIDPNAPIKAHEPKAESSTNWPPVETKSNTIKKLVPQMTPSFE